MPLNYELRRCGRSHADDDLLELDQKDRADRRGGDAAGAAQQRRSAEHHDGDRRQQIAVADQQARNAQIAGEQNSAQRIKRTGDGVGRDLVGVTRKLAARARACVDADRHETATPHGCANDDLDEQDQNEREDSEIWNAVMRPTAKPLSIGGTASVDVPLVRYSTVP